MVLLQLKDPLELRSELISSGFFLIIMLPALLKAIVKSNSFLLFLSNAHTTAGCKYKEEENMHTVFPE